MEETNVLAEAATDVAVSSATNGRKSGLVIGVCAVATLGVAYGAYKAITAIKARRAAKKAAKEAKVEE